MILQAHELQSTVWQKVREEIELQIATLRQRNEGDLDLNETNRVRGQIRALRNLLAQAEGQFEPVTAEPDD
jgi:hypothetical protein